MNVLNGVNNSNINMKHIPHVEKSQRNWIKKNYIYSFFKFKNQNLSKFRPGKNFNF